MIQKIFLALALAIVPSVAAWADNIPLVGVQSHKNEPINDRLTAIVNYETVWPLSTDQAVVVSIRNWVCDCFGDSQHEYFEDIVKLLEKGTQKEVEELKEEGCDFSGDWTSEFSSEVIVEKTFENDAFITLCCTRQGYLGGAHGYNYVVYNTFRKSDGHEMGWELLGDLSKGEIVRKIKTGLYDYAGVQDDEALMEALCMDREMFYHEFPLPETAPFLSEEGVAAVYQQYEIGPYSIGMPSCLVVPMSEFKPTPEETY